MSVAADCSRGERSAPTRHGFRAQASSTLGSVSDASVEGRTITSRWSLGLRGHMPPSSLALPPLMLATSEPSQCVEGAPQSGRRQVLTVKNAIEEIDDNFVPLGVFPPENI